MKRRQYLSGLAGIGALSSIGAGQVAASDRERLRLTAVGDDTHHPGPPRFTQVGVELYDDIFTNFTSDHAGGKDRDNFSPQIVGEPERDPDNYSADDFSWTITSAPEDSEADLEYAPSDEDGGETHQQYDSGNQNVVEFAPDVPGEYVFELDAPDGTHEQTIHVFPERTNDAGGPPRISLDGHYDGDNDEFVVESNPELAPNSPASRNDVVVEWLADDRDAFGTEDITAGEGTDTWTARIPKSALDGERSRIHAAPTDGKNAGYSDMVVLDPEAEALEFPNRPPEWIENGIMYEIFPRSFEGPPPEGEWPLQNSRANFANMKERLDYIDSLNVDVIWFTPVVPSESANWKPQNHDQWDGDDNRFKFVGGGPHGYDALSYTEIAEDLGSEYSFEEYREEPWAWEDDYDPEDNLREDARENAMDEFQEFVQEAHDRDIKICFDLVINHCGRHHEMFQDTISGLRAERPAGWTYKGIAENNTSSKYFDWFARKDGPITNGGDVVDPAPTATGFAGLRVMPQWNYGNVAVREHILAAADMLSSDIGVDAFRCDIAYGVPHSFWKEVRELVRSNDSEFMLLDETIPNDPNFAESEFDMHFDTADFMQRGAHPAAEGDDPMKIYDMVAKRDEEGWPEHTLITNAIENHDEERTYVQAKDGSREDPAKAQRAAWASGVVLPGVPFIYYGQERLIGEYGEERFDFDGTGEDYRVNDGDAGPGNPARAFMNWEEYDEEHLEFYRQVTDFYHQTEALKPHADLSRAWFRSDADVMVCGRTLEHEDEDDEHFIAVVHFDPGTAEVDLLPGASTEYTFTDSDDASIDASGEAVTVEVDTLAMVETDSLYSVGERIALLDDEAGDDTGPGSYTYPTGEPYTESAFDVSEVTIHDGGDSYQFRYSIEGDLTNPFDFGNGFSLQYPQVYISNPNAEDGVTEGREGSNVTFDRQYQYRVIADGENGARVENASGEQVAEGSVMTNAVANEMVIEMPKDVLNAGIRSHYLSPLLLGYDGLADGGVRAVQAEAGEHAFGGADPAENAPGVIDAVVPDNTTQAEALAYSADAMAEIPFVQLTSEFEKIGEVDDEVGDDNGPGSYEKPTGDPYNEGAWDIETVEIYESRGRVRFEYHMAEEIQNNFGLERGFSQAFPQVYIRDPEAGDDVPSSTEGRNGTNTNFADPYHYRVVVNGQNAKQVESAEGDSLSSDVNVSVDEDTIAFDLPKDAIGGSPTDKELAVLALPFDGFGPGTVRAFASSPDTHTVGVGGGSAQNAPHVMDMIPPEGTSQQEALVYSDSAKAQIPFATWDSTFVQSTGGGTIEDPEGDDYGPGSYVYPTADDIPADAYDVTAVDVENTTQGWNFTVHLNGELNDPWGNGSGFSIQLFQIYLQDPNAGDDAPEAVQGRAGVVSQTQEAHHYRVSVSYDTRVVENANGEVLAEGFEATGNPDESTISFTVPKSQFETDSFSEMKAALLMFSQDDFGDGQIRGLSADEGQWTIGGADPIENAPKVMDMVAPDSVLDQTEALSYSPDSPARIPLIKGEYLLSGQLPQTNVPTAIASPGPTVFAGQPGSLDASSSSDPNDQELSFSWEQTGGPDVKEFTDTDTAQPSFVAPDVEEETALEFTVTVTNPDDNSATSTTSATVQPQSANDAPIAEAQLGIGYELPIASGERVEVNAYNSEDPNGGSLSFLWEQVDGPSVDLVNVEGSSTFFDAPDVDGETSVTLQLTVSDGQGKSTTDTIEITVEPGEDGEMTTTAEPTTTEEPMDDTTTEDDSGGDTEDGDGPGFGVVSSVLGTAGGAAYAARSLLSDDSEPEEIEAEVLDDEDTEPVESDD